MFSTDKPPIGLRWRAHTIFILATVAIGLFTDLFLYGLIVPVLPFMLRDRVDLPREKVQSHVSGLLAAYAGASCLLSLPAGWIADRTQARQIPYLTGLVALLASTILLALGRSVPVLILARLLQGMAAAVVWTVGMALLMDTVGSENLGKTIGSIFSFISVGELVAPVVGGILYKKTGYLGVFGVSAAILGLDFFMRLLVIEKKVAARYGKPSPAGEATPQDGDSPHHSPAGNAGEEDALLPTTTDQHYKVREDQNRVVRALPILICLSDPRLLVALLLTFVQALLLGTFDATIPTEAQSLFDFDSLKAGLLFIALDIPYLICGPIAGWAVDRYGTKPAAVLGFGTLVPTLFSLRLPSARIIQDRRRNIILYCGLLSMNGVGMAMISAPSIVEASEIVQNYHNANPGFFGPNGPYAQLYGFSSLTYSAGLTIGPVLSGTLRDLIGYGNMNAVIAVIAGITATLSFIFVGGKPEFMDKRNWHFHRSGQDRLET